MESLFDRFAERRWFPAADVSETKDEMVLTFDIPGVTEKDLTLSITGDLLTLKGERRFEADEKDMYHRVERVYGRFERSVQLPATVQTDKVTARYRDGVLEIKLPKAEEAKPREIKIDLL
jgi:HSP20 family protein